MSTERDDLANYFETNYTANCMVPVGAGGVDHQGLIKLAEKPFSSLRTPFLSIVLLTLAPTVLDYKFGFVAMNYRTSMMLSPSKA